ncbi:MAG TPA: 4-hydroxy-tetrahydrodipicolinate reductase [Actinomycetota bacterium]|nr:4-hydroxy-tetrahydrodipicolinate reductase [Actinomycetota bacterium]
MIRVGVIGATGKVGAEVCRAVHADPDMELVAGISRSKAGEKATDGLGLEGSGVVLAENLDSFVEAGVEVAVDFTSAQYAPEHVEWAIDHGTNIVVGTTGFEVDDAWREAAVGVFVAPNFAIGAVLMQRFAREAARHLPAVEIVELHHDGKSDAPSGTAMTTAREIAAARAESPPAPSDEKVAGARGGAVDDVRIHSIRLPGLVAHQEVIFGGQAQTLTIRHDSTDRTSFVPGVLMAIRWIPDHPGLTVGLEHLLDG